MDRSWRTYVDPSLDRGEGYAGLVLCVLCFAELVEREAGAEEALAVLKRAFRRHQERIAIARQPRPNRA
jgi:hypothetical protein